VRLGAPIFGLPSKKPVRQGAPYRDPIFRDPIFLRMEKSPEACFSW
jgi:hypothetical protein